MKMNKTTVTMNAMNITTPLVPGWKRLGNSVRFFYHDDDDNRHVHVKARRWMSREERVGRRSVCLGEQDSRQLVQRERCIAQVQRFVSIRTLMAEGTLRITCRHLKFRAVSPNFTTNLRAKWRSYKAGRKRSFPSQIW